MAYLDDISNMDNSLKVKHIYSVEKYIVIITNKENYFYDGETLYSLKDYDVVEKVIVFNKEIYIVVKDFGDSYLVRLKDLEIIYKSRNLLGINLLSERYISIHSYSESSKLFDLKMQEVIKSPLDLKFEYILTDDIFVFENNEYDLDKHKRYIVNNKGEIIYECGNSFPYFVNGNLYLISRSTEEINIIHDFLGNRAKSTIIKKEGIVLGKPQYYNGDIVIIVDEGILIMDADLNIKKKVPYLVKNPITDTTIERNTFLMKIKEDEVYRTVAVGLEGDFMLEHDSIELLPYWLDRKRTILSYDIIDDKLRSFSLYDETGKFLFNETSLDAHIVNNKNYNLFIFYRINGEERNKIFNIDTNKEIDIPWEDVVFKTISYRDYHNYALCYNMKTSKYDIVDDKLNVCFKDIDLDSLGVRKSLDNLGYFVNNNYVSIIEPVYDGPATYFRKIILDKDNNVIYNSFKGEITHIGNYIEIRNEDGLRYINTKTGEVTLNKENALLPDNIIVENNALVLKKS